MSFAIRLDLYFMQRRLLVATSCNVVKQRSNYALGNHGTRCLIG